MPIFFCSCARVYNKVTKLKKPEITIMPYIVGLICDFRYKKKTVHSPLTIMATHTITKIVSLNSWTL